jgi:nucleoside 2-deoxyribosyltransferase
MTTLPRVYCASPWRRAKMWRTLQFPSIRVVSTWHHKQMLDATESNAPPDVCAAHWQIDLAEIRQADALLAYAEFSDRPNGTLFEIGYANALDTPVALVGNFEWGTWKHLPLIAHYPTLREAVEAISGVPADDPS